MKTNYSKSFRDFSGWPSLFFIMISLPVWGFAQNQTPAISNLTANNNENDGTVTITYDLSDAEKNDVEILLRISPENAFNFNNAASNLSGDIGYPVSPGTGKAITWDYPDTLSNPTDYLVKLIADDRQQVNVQEVVNQVDSQRLKDNLAFIAQKRHRQDSLEHLKAVKDTLENTLSSYGLKTRRHEFPFEEYDAANIIGLKNGIKPSDTTYIIDAHFDAVQGSPGADDNGSAVVGLLEAARILSKYEFDHAIRFIGFDLEEEFEEESREFRVGSREYVATQIPNEMAIGGVFNFEMIGYKTEEKNTQNLPTGFGQLYPNVASEIEKDSFRGDFIANVANGNSGDLMQLFDSAASMYVPSLDVISIGSPAIGGIPPDLRRSDHASFWDSGHVALMLTNTANFRNPNYHSPQDTVGYLDYTFMSRVIKATIGAVSEKAQIQHSSASTTQITNTSSIKADEAIKHQVKIYPNPAISKTVRITSERGFHSGLRVTVFNANGQAILEKPIVKEERQSITLSTGRLDPGIYYLQLEGDHRSVSKKLLVK